MEVGGSLTRITLDDAEGTPRPKYRRACGGPRLLCTVVGIYALCLYVCDCIASGREQSNYAPPSYVVHHASCITEQQD